LPAVSATTAATSQTARHVCVVPKLTGRTLTSARRALQRAGCAPGRIGHTSRRGGQAGRVVSQSPKAGRRVREGARVTVLVRRR
jgi:beta-lactam-binding protein with PASTA domain